MMTVETKKRSILFALMCIFSIMYFFQIQMAIKVYVPIKITPIFYFLFYVLLLHLMLKDKIEQHVKLPGVRILFLLILIIFLSSINAEIPSQSFYQLAHIVSFVMIYFLIVATVRNFTDVKEFLNRLLIAGTAVVIIARTKFLAQYFPEKTTWYTTLSGARVIRESFLYLDVNTYAYMLSILIVLTVYKLFFEKSSLQKNVCYVLLLILFLSSLVYTHSRMSMLVVVLEVLIMLIVSKKIINPRVVFAIVLMVTFLCVVLFSTGILDEIEHRIKDDFVWEQSILSGQFNFDSSLGYRLRAANYVVGMFAKRPLLGWGDGGLQANYSSPTGNHIYYLNLLGKNGIFALICFMIFLLVIFSHLKKSIVILKTKKDPNVSLGYLFFGIMIGLVVKGVFAPLGFNFWIMAGMSMAFYQIARETKKGNHRKDSKIAEFKNR